MIEVRYEHATRSPPARQQVLRKDHMNSGAKLCYVAAICLSGCGPSTQDYEAAKHQIAELEKQNVSLRAEVSATNKAIEELRTSPSALFSAARSAGNDALAKQALEELIKRHPNAKETEDAKAILVQIDSRTAEAARFAKVADAARLQCEFKEKKLPPNFTGTNVRVVIAKYSQAEVADKGEFETSTDYAARLSTEAEAVAHSSQCVFLEPQDVTYDADGKRWVVSVFADVEYMGMVERPWNRSYQFDVDTDAKDLGTYTAKNAFGVEKEIAKRRYDRFGVAFLQPVFDQALRTLGVKTHPNNRLFRQLTIPMPLEEARRHSPDDLKLFVQYQWVPKFLVWNSTSHSPTLKEPWDEATDASYLTGTPLKIWLVHKPSGAVLAPK